MKRINAIYARQSVDRADSISIESQIEFCKYELKGGSFKEYKDKGYSGKNTVRPQLQQLLTDIRRGEVEKVIVYKLDRISRSILDFSNMMNLFQQYQVEFVSSTEKFDTSTPMGRAMLNICIVFAQLERETIQKRVSDAYYSRSQKGFRMGGKPPYGYRLEEILMEGIHTKKLVEEPVEKVNVTLDGIILREEGRNISPTIYINDMYKKYQDCGDLEETLMAACDFMERAYEQAPVVDVDSIMKDANEKIVFQLINTEQNKTFLEQVPHREFQDLSIVYKVIISADKDAVQSSKITNEFAKRLGMSEEQLFKCAAENTRRLFPPVVRSMNDIMKEMFARDGMPQEIADMMIAEIPPEQTMWVISNEKGINGAASMLYENELHELAESLESDLYILPSSVHEVIAVSSDMGSPEMLAQMVVEVNMQEVSLDERLSNQVYHYDKDLRKLTLATDTPNKRLDGIVAEPPLVYDAKEKSR